MHEASIVESLIGLVRQNLPEGRRVRQIDVRVGLLTGVSPDAMQFYFEIMREDTLGPQAELAVTLEPLASPLRKLRQRSFPDRGGLAVPGVRGADAHLAKRR